MTARFYAWNVARFDSSNDWKIAKTRFPIIGTVAKVMAAAIITSSQAAELYVSPSGDDANLGSAEKPFLTVQRARDAARGDKASTIHLSAGTYPLSRTFDLSEQDSGTHFVGDGGIRLTGGIEVLAGNVKPVDDSEILQRLLPEVRGKVLEIDLQVLGVTDFGGIGPRGFGHPYLPAPVELFVDGEPLSLSQWPKHGQSGEPIGKVLDDGTNNLARGERPHGGTFKYASDRPARWTKAEDVWITGFFFNGYADDTLKVKSFDVTNKTLTTVQRHGYGFNSGKPWNRWTALNLLEEIAQPGEYALDSKTGKLFFLPPAGKDIAKCRLAVSVLQEPMVSIKGATNVVFDGIDFECSRGIGVYIERGASNRIQNATLRNLGELAVCVGMAVDLDRKTISPAGGPWRPSGDPLFNRNAGAGHGIVNCKIYNVGAGGISLGGGDRRSLTAAGNFVENCEIHHFNRWDRTYRGAINMDGVGNSIRHCLIHDCPGVAIYLHGNEHLIEHNEIHHAIMEGDDMGAFYMGRDPTERGTIVRFNYWHDLAPAHATHCLYFDDSGGDSAKVYGNIFRKAGSLSTVNINGGSDIIVTNNIFIDCKKPIRMGHGGNEWRTKQGRFESLIKNIGCDKSPWRERYPELLTYLADRPQMPRGNRFANNVLVNSPASATNGFRMGNNFTVSKEPDAKNAGIPDFAPIPANKIGLEFHQTH